ncbi:MAG: ATP-binding cassette domain-containing protein [Rhodospirillales bacterium]|jgi:putative ABC transport system ATP-binding protein|nr:ATP-binding cassette domain-containing protein [Rhodospirillales bacterium]MDP7099259.1 ATP-binding cassette domain-containing protein [Rhodospirillales bacterium]MDP7215393.1 ATP-binding cassette domain-containing protein [Rhodospirillales bacterium]HIJ43265.1 ATP-binding cassette domain-containing protein [Rhodospirillaceae bacterium]HJP55046.1 ATP-binding cassette domain-containing protein [Rhodospirillales bacterium]
MLTNGDRNGPDVRLDGVHLNLIGEAGEVNILRGIDLRIDGGETVAVAGPSGSGKTSMLMVIAGLETPTSGVVETVGVDLGRLNEDQLAIFRRRHIGIVFQDFHLVPTMTAVENVALPLEFAGSGEAFGRARQELAAVGLGHRLGHYPGQLSGGEQQRVAMARAFVAEPTILLADEPTGNLDGATGRAVLDVLFAVHKRLNTTLILVTHQPEVADRCARVVHLTDGRIAGDRQRRSRP